MDTEKRIEDHKTDIKKQSSKRDAMIMANARQLLEEATIPNWWLYLQLFGLYGLGATSIAVNRCKSFGLDPYGYKTDYYGILKSIG